MLLALCAATAQADPLRVATWAGDFSKDGPGLLLRDLVRDPGALGLGPILTAEPDILLLTDFDYDAGQAALTALRAALAAQGLDYPYAFSARPNSGMQTGVDLDGDGRTGGPRDAQGFGFFSGYGGQAILSRVPLTLVADHAGALWRDAPRSLMAPADPAPDIQRLASTTFWQITAETEDGPLTLLTLAATPPVFDGPEDRNGRRNHDEVLFWHHRLDGINRPVILLGNFNLDPDRGDGLRNAVQTVLENPALQDPAPGSDTVSWDSTGPMRVSYVLPDARLTVLGAGTVGPDPDAGPHALVWVDVE